MRHIRLTVGLLATVGAFAVIAAPALAAEFEASKAGAEAGSPVETKGAAVGEQSFHSGPVETAKGVEHFTVKCNKGKSTGTATEGLSTKLVDKVTFSKCTSGKKGAKFEGPLELKYNSDGAVEIGEVRVKLSEAKCFMTIEAQEVDEESTKSAAYENVTKEGKKGSVKELGIVNSLKKLDMEFEPVHEGHGICAALTEEESEKGSYKGLLEDEVIGGSLALVEPIV